MAHRDAFVWGRTSNGRFTTVSAYELLEEDNREKGGVYIRRKESKNTYTDKIRLKISANKKTKKKQYKIKIELPNESKIAYRTNLN